MSGLLLRLVAFVSSAVAGPALPEDAATTGAPAVRPEMTPYRIDEAYISTPSDWSVEQELSTSTDRAFRQGDSYVVYVGAYDRGSYEPASEDDLATEILDLAALAQEADPDLEFGNEEPLVDTGEDGIYRGWLDAVTVIDGAPVQLRYVVSFDPRVNRFCFITLNAFDPADSDADVDALLEDLVWEFEYDAFDPDVEPVRTGVS